MFDTHVDVKDLPWTLRDALKAMDYNRASISIESQETYDLRCSAGDGERGVAAIVDLKSGVMKRHVGSFGGPNPWESHLVDSDNTRKPTLRGQAVIKGNEAAHCHFAYVILHPDDFKRLAPAKDEHELTPRQVKIVNVVVGNRGGYRKDELDRGRVETWELQQLEETGYLKINRAGAVSYTTKARNLERGCDSHWGWSDEEMRKPERVERAERSFAVEGAYLRTEDNLGDPCVWIRFPNKPPLFVRNEMKANGFRWDRDKRAWVPTLKTYQKLGDRTSILAFAEKFVPKEMAA